jgi:hypothetical protein
MLYQVQIGSIAQTIDYGVCVFEPNKGSVLIDIYHHISPMLTLYIDLYELEILYKSELSYSLLTVPNGVQVEYVPIVLLPQMVFFPKGRWCCTDLHTKISPTKKTRTTTTKATITMTMTMIKQQRQQSNNRQRH